jgi:elongation factor G
MAHKGAQRIRNIAIVGHRGSGKTSLNEALLFEAGVINRLGNVADGFDRVRLGARRAGARDVDRREPVVVRVRGSQDQLDRTRPATRASSRTRFPALSVCESAVFCVNGVMGVEVSTDRPLAARAGARACAAGFVNMLDRERADFFRTLDSLKEAFGPARGGRPRSRSAPSTGSAGSST